MKIPQNDKYRLGVAIFCILFLPLPIGVFISVLLFATSETGKKYFDQDAWKDEDDIQNEKTHSFSFSKSKKNDKKTEEKENKEEINTEKPKKNTKNIPNFFTQKLMSPMKFELPDPSNPPSSGSMFGLLTVGILIFGVVALVTDGIVSIPAGHTGVVFNKIAREVEQDTLPQGINFKIPFFEQVTIIDTRIQEESISASKDPIEALTSDGQSVGIDITVQYEIDNANAASLYEKVGLDYKSKIVTPGVRSVVRSVVTGYDSKELFKQEKRVELEQEIVEQLKSNYSGNFVTLKNALVRDVRFSEEYLKTIEDKKIAEQEIEKSEFQRKNAEVQKEKIIIEAQAEAESIKLKGEALSNSPEVIQLQFVEKMAPSISWGIMPDGALPLIDLKSLQNQ